MGRAVYLSLMVGVRSQGLFDAAPWVGGAGVRGQPLFSARIAARARLPAPPAWPLDVF